MRPSLHERAQFNRSAAAIDSPPDARNLAITPEYAYQFSRVAFFVIDNAALAMGSLGGYPPLLAAWAPFALFALIGETVLIRTEE